MKAFTLSDHRRRMRRVTMLISKYAAAQMAGDPQARLSLPDLADAACWSPEHFSRVWQTCTAETPLTSVRRSLLELSKDALLVGESVSSVADRAAYGSGQAFAHAFFRQFGHSATNFIQLKQAQPERPAEYRIFVIEDPVPILTATYTGEYSDAGDFSSACMSDLRPVLSRHAQGFYFLMDDLPQSAINMNGRFGFQFGLSPSARLMDGARFDMSAVRPGTYACIRGVGPWGPGDIDDMLRDDGWQRRDAPIIERLHTDRALTPEPLRKEYLWVPVAPR